jgi:hypothetical protein
LVVQLKVARLVVMPLALTPLITGGVVSADANVVKDESADMARLPAPSADLTL